MLVLTRKVNQRIQIGPDVWLTLLAIRGNKVHIGIDAPPCVTVLREELCHGRTTDSKPVDEEKILGHAQDSLAD